MAAWSRIWAVLGKMPLRRGRKAWGVAEEDAVACGADGVRADEVGDPPGLELAEEEDGVADPEPDVEGRRVGLMEEMEAAEETEGEGQALQEGDEDEAGRGVIPTSRIRGTDDGKKKSPHKTALSTEPPTPNPEPGPPKALPPPSPPPAES